MAQGAINIFAPLKLPVLKNFPLSPPIHDPATKTALTSLGKRNAAHRPVFRSSVKKGSTGGKRGSKNFAY